MRDVGSAPNSSVFFSNSIGLFLNLLGFAGCTKGWRRSECVRHSNDDLKNCLPEPVMCGYKSAMNTCRLVTLSLAIVSAVNVLAQQPAIQQSVESELPSCLSIYKDIHSHPELSGREEHTSALVAKELRAAGCEVTENFGTYDKPNLKCYGVVGVMKNGNGPTVLIRTDMDALPVQEQTGAPYA